MWSLVRVVYFLVAAATAQVMLPDRPPFKLHGPPLKPPVPPRIYAIHVDTIIMHGYARSSVEYEMYNLDEAPMDVEFAHSFPPNAYVTDFQIQYGNGMHKTSQLQLREGGSRENLNAIHGGLPVGNHKNSRHAKNFGHSNYFGASTYVKPFENVTFQLQYEELLLSKFGLYEYELELRPQEVVESLQVTVRIADTKKIVKVAAPAITGKKAQNQGNPFAEIRQNTPQFVTVTYSPTKWQQRDHHSRGINGVFKVQYQTEAMQYGDYKIGNGYFAYYFSPTIPTSMQKHLIVAMDTSDSMVSVESQLNAALGSLMSILTPGDKYSVIEFGSTIRIWNGEKFANPNTEMSNIEDFSTMLLKEYGDASPVDYVMRKIAQAKQSTFQGAGRDTNLNLALDAALSIAQSGMQSENAIPLIVLMTDGKVTVGERNFEKIIQRTRQLSKESVPIFTLAMGEKAEEAFLSRLASDNYAFSIRIKENDPDVFNQLKGFQKLMEPIVGSMTIDLKEFAVHDSVSTYTFGSHFRGSEKVVTGKLIEPKKEGGLVVYMNTAEGALAFEQGRKYDEREHMKHDSDWFLERIWAYNTIKDMIRKIASRESLPEIHAAQRKASDLSMKYNFASELTSLLVRTVGHAPDIQNEALINLNGPTWSDEGPARESTGAAQFGFLGGLTLSFVPQIVPFHELLQDDLRRNFDWPVQIGVDGTAILQNGKTLKLGFGKAKLPYGDGCITTLGQQGICRLVHFCETKDYRKNFAVFVKNSCKYLDTNIYDGVCCPLETPNMGAQSRVDTETTTQDYTTLDESTTETASTFDMDSTTTTETTGTDSWV